MKLPLLLFVLTFVSSVLAADKTTPATQRHPLTGIVTAVYGERSALMVKHEDIPGLMRAMTMMFKVDETTVKTVKIGDKISAQVSREEGEWRLHDVKVVEAKKS